jgi:hypothetical protein
MRADRTDRPEWLVDTMRALGKAGLLAAMIGRLLSDGIK